MRVSLGFMLARDLFGEPSEDLDGKLDEAHRQVREPRTAYAARAQATQHRPAWLTNWLIPIRNEY